MCSLCESPLLPTHARSTCNFHLSLACGCKDAVFQPPQGTCFIVSQRLQMTPATVAGTAQVKAAEGGEASGCAGAAGLQEHPHWGCSGQRDLRGPGKEDQRGHLPHHQPPSLVPGRWASQAPQNCLYLWSAAQGHAHLSPVVHGLHLPSMHASHFSLRPLACPIHLASPGIGAD